MTARQYLMLGEDPPGVRLELVDGEIAVSASPMPRHSYADRALTALLWIHVESKDLGLVLGDTDTIFGEFDVRRPDIIYFTKQRAHLVEEDEAISGPPDLCIEIVSPSSVTVDRTDKFEQYAKGKVRFYWIVDPKNRLIEAFKLVGGRYKPCGSGANNDVVSLPPFPDLKIPLKSIWFAKKR
jgi:Uma2 family endonuclease